MKKTKKVFVHFLQETGSPQKYPVDGGILQSLGEI
jgi:hypothetical protein